MMTKIFFKLTQPNQSDLKFYFCGLTQWSSIPLWMTPTRQNKYTTGITTVDNSFDYLIHLQYSNDKTN